MHGGMLQECEGGGRVRDAECVVTGSKLRVGEGVSGSSWRGEANGYMLHLAMGSDPVRVDNCDWDSRWGVQGLRDEVSGSNSVTGRTVSGSAGGEEAIGRMLFFWQGWTSLRLQICNWDWCRARLGLRARVRIFQGGLVVGPRAGFRVASVCASNTRGCGQRRAWRGRAAYLRQVALFTAYA